MQALLAMPGFSNQANSAISFGVDRKAKTRENVLSACYKTFDSPDKSMYSRIESAREKAKIKDYLSLVSKFEENWDDEGALKISDQVLRLVDNVIEYIGSDHLISLPEVEANPNGTISMYWYWSNGRAEIEVGLRTFSWVVFSMRGKVRKVHQESGENQRLIFSLVKFIDCMVKERNNSYETAAHISNIIFSYVWRRLDGYR